MMGDGGNGGGGTEGTYHPFIEGLLKTLPKTGTKWALRDRAKWLKLAGNAFDLIYEADDEGTISIRRKRLAQRSVQALTLANIRPYHDDDGETSRSTGSSV